MLYGAITRERHYMLTARHNRPTSRAPSKYKPYTEAPTLIRDEDKGEMTAPRSAKVLMWQMAPFH